MQTHNILVLALASIVAATPAPEEKRDVLDGLSSAVGIINSLTSGGAGVATSILAQATSVVGSSVVGVITSDFASATAAIGSGNIGSIFSSATSRVGSTLQSATSKASSANATATRTANGTASAATNGSGNMIVHTVLGVLVGGTALLMTIL